MKNFKKPFLSILTCTALFTGCKKEEKLQIAPNIVKVKDSPNYNFPWYSASTMPVSASATPVSMPWQSQSGSPIDASIVSDYQQSDGWQLVYDTFNTTVIPTASGQPAGGLYFALYNVYRGLLRFYLYIPPSYISNNSDIEHGLAISSNTNTTSKMLNFEGGDIVDPSGNISDFVKTNNNPVAYGGGWYAMQYEIAYDPNFASTSYPGLGFTWHSKTVSISQINLNGTQQGTISGNITQKSSGFNWAGAIVNGIIGAAEIYGTAGLSLLGTMSANMTSAATGGLAGNITGLLSGIFGGNSGNTQEVDLKMNSAISLNGTITGSQPLTPNNLVVPGQTIANTVGAPTPIYQSPLGVFNFPSKPVVHITSTKTTAPSSWDGPSNAYYVNRLTIDPTFLSSIQKNPAVIAGSSTVPAATITVQNAEILLENFDASSSFYNYTESTEAVSNLTLVKNTTIDGGKMAATAATALVRVTVAVTPNNTTTPPVTIVKTFLATLSNP
ncbi:hypothetical protein [Mucilaginibacter jinjuensis]|uniref:Uncharacterized protein n=1 Tax=Mucilaginibacter jinjuensis TaxID=1176721 RepID=A0ABY7TGG1_9SPHI|nr:hypothetical protein [Mucilaginibacter jinjuensis]WCT14242.1 hypothetical protein PQO05_09885 [Mucilaginibacter jinjuensis]